MIVHVLVVTRSGSVVLERSAGGSRQMAEVRARVAMRIDLAQATEGTKKHTFLGEREGVYEAVGELVAIVTGEEHDTRASELADALDMLTMQLRAASGKRSPTEAQVRSNLGQAILLVEEAIPLNVPECPDEDATRRLAKLKTTSNS